MKEKSSHLKGSLLMLFLCGLISSNGVQAQNAETQAVTEVITDYNGFWQSGSTNINPIKPENSHNLLSFTYNGIRYSTGVNDQLLTAQGQAFSAQDFYALDMQYFTGPKVPDTYIGLGQLYDGVNNGPSVPPPYNNIPYYLMDGPHGLDIGTCVANLPNGYIVFGVNGIDPASIGDGVPDILITQVAQPSSATDQYAFRDANGNIIGNAINIQLGNIQPVGNWIADFYRAMHYPMFIPAGFVKTERPMRLWAADLADFGITAADVEAIQSFSIRLAGTTDIAFIAYNYNTANITPLPAGLALEKEGTFMDENGNCMPDVGETIRYDFRVYNTGDTPIFNVQVEDNNVEVIGAPINLNGGASNISHFYGIHTITQADIDAGAVYNSATVTGINQEGEDLSAISLDPTPIDVSSPYYDETCEDCTVTVLPQSAQITIPNVTMPSSVCDVDSMLGLPYSTTATTITRTQFTSAGGTLISYMPVTSITYVDEITQEGCPTLVKRTFTITTCTEYTVEQIITIQDTTAPTIQPLEPLIVQACNVAFPAPDASVVNATDNCNDVTISFVSDSAVTLNGCAESIVRTYRATDACGNATDVTQTITRYMDAVNPTASNLPDFTVTQINAAFPDPNTALVTAYDNCGTPTVTFIGDSEPTANGCQESIVRTYSVADSCGNTIQVTQNLHRTVDTEAPIVAALPDVIAQCEITLSAPQVQDECSGVVTATTSSPVYYNQQGTYTVNWVFTDAAGNAVTVPQTVIIQNDLIPTAPVLNTVYGECTAVVSVPTYLNGCNNETITATTSDALEYNAAGNYTVTWTFDLGEGIVLTSIQQVVVDDTIAPVAPAIETVVAECSTTVVAPIAQDNCSGDVTGTTTDATSFNTPGTYNITWTFTDASGNISSATQTVIVNAAEVVIPTLETVTASCSALVAAPSITDPCTNAPILGSTTAPLMYDEQGTYTITWTFLVYGQTYTATQQVIINDAIAPVAPELETVTGLCSATVTAPTATDNCSGDVTGTTTDALTYTTAGTYQITWTFTDAAGNASTAVQTVIVENDGEVEIPTLEVVTAVCQVTVPTPSVINPCTGETVNAITENPTTYTTAGEYTITWTFIVNNQAYTATQTVVVEEGEFTAPVLEAITSECNVSVEVPVAVDPCTGIEIAATTTDDLDYSTIGTYTINWVFTVNGQDYQVAQQVTVTDTAAPVAPVLETLEAACFLEVTQAPIALDECSGEVVGTTTSQLVFNEQGTYEIVWTFTDAAGLTSTATQTVVINNADTTPLAGYIACNDDEFFIDNFNNYLPEGTATNGTWVDLSNTGGLTGASFTAYGLEVGIYNFEYTVQDGECNVVYTLAVEIDDDCAVLPACSITVHNAVTPNNDGMNDFFFIEGLTDVCFTSNSVEIYNRWGVKVYEANNYDNNTVKFDGQSEGRSTLKKGEDLPAGTYFYILRYADTDGKAHEKSGYLYLSK